MDSHCVELECCLLLNLLQIQLDLLMIVPGIIKTFFNISLEIESFGGLCTAFEVIKPGAIDKLKEIAGPDSVEEARKTSPGSLHAKFGLVGYKNGVYVAKSHQSATEVEFII